MYALILCSVICLHICLYLMLFVASSHERYPSCGIRLIINNSTTKQQKYDGAALRPNVGNQPTEETRQQATATTVCWVRESNCYYGMRESNCYYGMRESNCYYGMQSRQNGVFAYRRINPALYDRVLCKHSVQAELPFVSGDN